MKPLRSRAVEQSTLSSPLRIPAVADGEAVAAATFIGLPGNPVASFVTFLILVRPFLLKRLGAERLLPAARTMVSASAWTRGDARREFLRARVTADGRVELYPNQGSGVLTSCAWADGLIDNPPGGTFQPGDSVRFLQFPGRG